MTRQDHDYMDEDARLRHTHDMLTALDNKHKKEYKETLSNAKLEAEYRWFEAQIEAAELQQERAEMKSINETTTVELDALKKQIGGNHYVKLAIQPIDYIVVNNLGFLEGNVVKYITRWKEKGGIQDLDKIIHYVEMLKQFNAGMVK